MNLRQAFNRVQFAKDGFVAGKEFLPALATLKDTAVSYGLTIAYANDMIRRSQLEKARAASCLGPFVSCAT